MHVRSEIWNMNASDRRGVEQACAQCRFVCDADDPDQSETTDYHQKTQTNTQTSIQIPNHKNTFSFIQSCSYPFFTFVLKSENVQICLKPKEVPECWGFLINNLRLCSDKSMTSCFPLQTEEKAHSEVRIWFKLVLSACFFLFCIFIPNNVGISWLAIPSCMLTLS